MDPVVHFEMPAHDRKRMRTFYEKAFGWKTNQLGKEFGDYVLATTTETDAKGMIKTPGNINGGFFQCPEGEQERTRITIAVKDIHAAMKQVEKCGGKVLGGMGTSGEPDMIPGVGLYANIIDSEVNRVSILQPLEMKK